MRSDLGSGLEVHFREAPGLAAQEAARATTQRPVEPRGEITAFDADGSCAVDGAGSEDCADVDSGFERGDISKVSVFGAVDYEMDAWTEKLVVEERPVRVFDAALVLVSHHQERPAESDRTSESAVQRRASVNPPVLVHGADYGGTAEGMAVRADPPHVQHSSQTSGQSPSSRIGVMPVGERAEAVKDEEQVGGAHLV